MHYQAIQNITLICFTLMLIDLSYKLLFGKIYVLGKTYNRNYDSVKKTKTKLVIIT